MKHLAFSFMLLLAFSSGVFADDLVFEMVGMQPSVVTPQGTVVEYNPASIVPNPAVGQSLHPIVYFSYTGPDQSSVAFRLALDGNNVCVGAFPLTNGTSAFFCDIPRSLEVGSHTLEAFLDTSNVVAESDETNNSGSVVYNIQGGQPPSTLAEQVFEFAQNWMAAGYTVEDLLAILAGGGGGGSTFDFCDYFVVAQNSNWHYTGVQGGSTEDDFTWTVEDEGQDVGGGTLATRIRTNTDEPTDDRNNAVDFWLKDNNCDVFFYGTFLPEARNVSVITIPSQNIVLTDPVRIGGAGQKVGDVVTDTGAGTLNVIVPIFGQQTVAGNAESTVTYQEIIPSFVTPLGTFTDVLKVVVDIQVSASGQSFELTNSTFFFKEGVGLVGQAQTPDPNDAEVQEIDQGTVAGVPVVAN